MAKFCTNCGKKLQDGEVCTCVKEKTSMASSFDVKESIDQTLDLVKGLFLKPTETIKKYVNQDNMILSIILLVLGAVISGLFVLVLLKEVIGVAFGMLFGASQSLFSSSMNMEIPYFKVFLITTLVAVATYFLEALIAFVFSNKWFKVDVDYKKMIHLFAALSVFTSLAFLASILGVYISFYIVYGLLLANFIVRTIVFAISLKEIWNTSEAHTMYTVLGTILITVLLVVLIVPKLFA